MDYCIRPIEPHETYILYDLIYEAIYQPDPEHLLPRSVIQQPRLAQYVSHWGQPDDVCLVAVSEGQIQGAAWTRVFSGAVKSYGWIDDTTPELVIAVFPAHRSQGMGTALLRKLIVLQKERGCRQISLSVSIANPALHLYQRAGFHIFAENAADYIMVKGLVDSPPVAACEQ